MALQASNDRAQAGRPGKLPVQQGNELALRRQTPHALVRVMRRYEPIELGPRNPLQEIVENAILVPHGVAPLSCPVTSPTSEHD